MSGVEQGCNGVGRGVQQDVDEDFLTVIKASTVVALGE